VGIRRKREIIISIKRIFLTVAEMDEFTIVNYPTNNAPWEISFSLLNDFVLIRQKRGYNATMQKSDKHSFDNFYSSANLIRDILYRPVESTTNIIVKSISRAHLAYLHILHTIWACSTYHGRKFSTFSLYWSIIEFYHELRSSAVILY